VSGKDYYSFLGVDNTASAEEIKRAYHKLAIKLHPDTSESVDGQAFIELKVIYNILSDPQQRSSYDRSRAYNNYQRKGTTSDYAKEKEKKQPQPDNKPENYFDAIFVSGIEAIDSTNNTSYIHVSDYIYYQVRKKNKLFFYSYDVKDYYRVSVKKAYSRRHNNFRVVPLFIVDFNNDEQVIFKEDFSKYWLSEAGFKRRERKQAIYTFSVELLVVAIIIFYLLRLK
jgi:DnaJ-class molecular chaperone